jgi:hypothetical protein
MALGVVGADMATGGFARTLSVYAPSLLGSKFEPGRAWGPK